MLFHMNSRYSQMCNVINSPHFAVGEANSGERGQNHWVKRASVVDSRTSVNDVKFSPKHLGLQLVRLAIFLVKLVLVNSALFQQ